MEISLKIVSILSIGLLIGTEFAVFAFVNPILAQVGGDGEAHATRLFAKTLGAVMPFWYALGLLLLVLQGIVLRHESGLYWIVAAAVLWVLAIAFSVFVLVPINNRIVAMGPEGFDRSLRAQHAHWDRLHRGRVAMLALAMILFLIGIQL